MKYYLAYGSNLNMEQMLYRCPQASPVGVAWLHDHALEFRTYLTVKPAAGCSVPLGVWSISSSDEARLDRYEGYPHFYRKETIKVQLGEETIEALIYIMNESVRPVQVPSGEYMHTCMDGYSDFELNHDYLTDAYLRAMTAQRF